VCVCVGGIVTGGSCGAPGCPECLVGNVDGGLKRELKAFFTRGAARPRRRSCTGGAGCAGAGSAAPALMRKWVGGSARFKVKSKRLQSDFKAKSKRSQSQFK